MARIALVDLQSRRGVSSPLGSHGRRNCLPPFSDRSPPTQGPHPRPHRLARIADRDHFVDTAASKATKASNWFSASYFDACHQTVREHDQASAGSAKHSQVAGHRLLLPHLVLALPQDFLRRHPVSTQRRQRDRSDRVDLLARILPYLALA